MQDNLLNELKQFYGTSQYHSSTFKSLNLTDGVNFLRNRANCFWLIDIVESVQYLPKIKANNSFILWRIEVKKNKGWIVSAKTDIGEPDLYNQKGDFTDFPLNEFEFYQCNNVLLLKSEY